MNLEKMTKEELIAVIKKHCCKVITDIPGTTFKKGEYYFLDNGEAGPFLIDDNGHYYDLWELDKPADFLEIKFK